jgi:L-methionine (R)-S-oxide reductase
MDAGIGFYVHSQYFPRPRIQGKVDAQKERLLLGPFCGKPACQFINVEEGHAHGVCADAFLQKETVVVANVDLYPGHIACDGETKSEIVCPLVLASGGITIVLGVLDLDCRAENGFDADDKVGLERLTSLMVKACDW